MTEQEEFEFRERAERERAAQKPGITSEEELLGVRPVRGALRGILGGLGELEKFGAYELPQMFGFKGQKPPKEGRATIFPTMEEVGRGMEMIGIPQPKKPTTSEKAGEFVGEFLSTGAKPVVDIAKYGTRKAQPLIDLLRGKTTAAEQAKLGTEAARAGTAAEQAIGSQAAKEQAALAQQAGRRTAAEAAGAKAQRTGESALRQLAGVRTLPEAGALKPIPAGKTEIGNYLRTQADKFVKSIKEARNKKADELFGKARGEAKAYAQVGQYVDTSPIIKKIDDLMSKGGTQDYLNSLQRLKSDIQATKNFEGLEVIRRKLGDAAFGAPEEGYKAISQQFAGDMREAVTQAMRDFSKKIGGGSEGAFGKYLDEYKRLSENLRVYGTKTGRGILETEGVGGQYFAKTGEKIADEMFSSPENYRKFVDAVGGNKQIVDAAARRYFAGILEGKTKPQDVEKVLKDYRDVLKEMPAVRTEIEARYLAPIRTAGRRVEAAKDIVSQTKDLDKQIAARLKNVEGSGTLISDAVKSISDAKPGKAIESFERALDKIRAAEVKAGTRLFSDQQIAALRQQAQQVEKIADKTQRARIIAGLLGTYLVGQTAVSGAGKLGGM